MLKRCLPREQVQHLASHSQKLAGLIDGLETLTTLHFSSNPKKDKEYQPEEEASDVPDTDEPLEYTSQCSVHSSDKESPDEPYNEDYPIQPFISLRMYVLADKYNVPALKLLAESRFLHIARGHWRT